jgi:hypothetical protein
MRHLQARGCLICRSDDLKEFSSVVAPLGQIYRKASEPKNKTHAVFVRPTMTRSSPSSGASDESVAASSSSVWQLLCEQSDGSPYGFGPVSSGSTVRLRNTLSGMFMCIRPSRDNDDDVLLQGAADGKCLLIDICNFHVLSHLIYICKLNLNLNTKTFCCKGRQMLRTGLVGSWPPPAAWTSPPSLRCLSIPNKTQSRALHSLPLRRPLSPRSRRFLLSENSCTRTSCTLCM